MIGDPFTMVVAIVFIAIAGGVLNNYFKAKGESAPLDDAETKRLTEEVTALKDRVKVLERIAIEKEDTLSRQIEDLRD